MTAKKPAQPVTLKPTKAQVGSAIAAIGSTLIALQQLLPVTGTAHLVIAIALVLVGGAGVYLGVFQTTNAPVDE